jgi:hypothetical protein
MLFHERRYQKKLQRVPMGTGISCKNKVPELAEAQTVALAEGTGAVWLATCTVSFFELAQSPLAMVRQTGKYLR